MSASVKSNALVANFREQLAAAVHPNSSDGAGLSESEARQLRDTAAFAAKQGKDVFEEVFAVWRDSRINPTGTTSKYMSQLSRILGSHEPQEGEERTLTAFRDALIDVMHPNSGKDINGAEYGSGAEAKLVRGLIQQAFGEQISSDSSKVFSHVRDVWVSSGINPDGETSDYIATLNPISHNK